MIDEIIKNKSLYEDELLLLIRKGNERARELFFSSYETILRNGAHQFKIRFNLPAFSEEDIYQEIKLSFINCINLYNFKYGKFYNFFEIVCKRDVLHELRNQTKDSNDSRKHLVFDENIDYQTITNIESLKFNDCYEVIENQLKNNDKHSNCLRLWIEGYSYKEISRMLKITVPSVNYHVRKSISNIREELMGLDENEEEE